MIPAARFYQTKHPARAMKHYSTLTPVNWVKRVNRTWLVKGRINETADAWLDYLAPLRDKRFKRSCENARAMCGLRQPLDDPKPWFYAGLFSLATAEEAKQFLATHRITRACGPAMENDEEVVLWADRVGPETTELLARIRGAIARLGEHPAR
jgi:hypothetical protein